jgi:hypothetical protein
MVVAVTSGVVVHTAAINVCAPAIVAFTRSYDGASYCNMFFSRYPVIYDYLLLKELVRRSTYVPFRRFLGDVRREFVQ